MRAFTRVGASWTQRVVRPAHQVGAHEAAEVAEAIDECDAARDGGAALGGYGGDAAPRVVAGVLHLQRPASAVPYPERMATYLVALSSGRCPA